MSQITAINSINEPGGILVLEMNQHDYTLTQIARIVEENNAKILSSFITSLPESTQIEVTLKINTTDLDRIIQTFQPVRLSPSKKPIRKVSSMRI
jgi:acetoin utilization protein AcuB